MSADDARALAGLAAAVLLIGLAGHLLLRILLPPALAPCRAERALLAAALGNAAIVLQLFGMSLANLPLRPAWVGVPWVLAALALWRRRRSHGGGPAAAPVDTAARRAGCRALLRDRVVQAAAAVVAIGLGALLMRVLTAPFVEGDSVYFWVPKGKVFFAHGQAPLAGFAELHRFFHADYPLFVPLTEAWLFLCMGRADVYLMKLVFPLYAGLLVASVGLYTARTAGPRAGWVAAALLATMPLVPWLAHAAMADLPLALYGGLATGLLLRHVQQPHPRWLLLCGLFAGMAGWVKNEGITLALVIGMVALLHSLWRRADAPAPGGSAQRLAVSGLVLGSVVLVLLPWLLVRRHFGLVSDLVLPPPDQMLVLLQQRWATIGRALAEQMFAPSQVLAHWNLLSYLLLPMLLLRARDLPGSPLRLVVPIIIGQLAVYVAVFVITPHDLAWHLSTSLDRLLLHLAPQVLLLLGWALQPWLEPHAA